MSYIHILIGDTTSTILTTNSITVDRTNIIINEIDRNEIQWFQHQSVIVVNESYGYNNDDELVFDNTVTSLRWGRGGGIVLLTSSGQNKGSAFMMLETMVFTKIMDSCHQTITLLMIWVTSIPMKLTTLIFGHIPTIYMTI